MVSEVGCKYNECVITLPAPGTPEIYNNNAASKWTTFQLAGDNFTIATKLSKEDETVQVGTLWAVTGEDTKAVFWTFTWVAR